MHTKQELHTVKYARTTLYLRTLHKRNTYVLRVRYVNFFLAPTVVRTDMELLNFDIIGYSILYVSLIRECSD